MNKYEVAVTWEMSGTVRIESESELTVERLAEMVDEQVDLDPELSFFRTANQKERIQFLTVSGMVHKVYQSSPFQINGTSHLQPCGGCGDNSWWTDEEEHVCKTGPFAEVEE